MPTAAQARSRRTLVGFISHSALRDISAIRRLLDEAGVQVRDSFGLPSASVITEGVVSDIRDAYFLIGILDAEAARVFFEIGFASALQKPVLLISDPGISPPFDIAQHRLVTAGIEDSEILKLTIRGFLKELESKRPHKRPRTRSGLEPRQQNTAAVRDALHAIQKLRQQASESELSRTTSELLKAAGVTAVEEFGGTREVGADFAVWIDALTTTFGNPILIELKAENLDQARWNSAHEQVARALGDSGARLGLLLYLDRRGRRFTEGAAGALIRS